MWAETKWQMWRLNVQQLDVLDTAHQRIQWKYKNRINFLIYLVCFSNGQLHSIVFLFRNCLNFFFFFFYFFFRFSSRLLTLSSFLLSVFVLYSKISNKNAVHHMFFAGLCVLNLNRSLLIARNCLVVNVDSVFWACLSIELCFTWFVSRFIRFHFIALFLTHIFSFILRFLLFCLFCWHQ